MPRPSSFGGIEFPVSVDHGKGIIVRQAIQQRVVLFTHVSKLSYLMNVELHSTKVCEARCMSAIRGVGNHCVKIFEQSLNLRNPFPTQNCKHPLSYPIQ